MLLDIGAKTSNLLFFEKGNVYSRGINIGANSITLDFAKESKLSFAEAEQLKVTEGFVSLGGAYEEPESPTQAAISKIARQVMTRLHIQVNQTIQFYRGQQGGSAPLRLFLSGGASSMPYTAQFFSEKLNLPVEYFNPFRNVQIDPSINLEEVAKVAHSMGEVVGLGLRNLAHCPVELNLIPQSSLKKQEFGVKKPFLIATACCLLLILGAYGWFFDKIAASKDAALQGLIQKSAPLASAEQRMKAAEQQLRTGEGEAEQLAQWLRLRPFWAGVLASLRDNFQKTEAAGKAQFKNETGVWIESLTPVLGEVTNAPPVRSGRRRGAAAPGVSMDSMTPLATTEAAAPRHVTSVLLTCRAVDLSQLTGNPSANTAFAYMLINALKANKHFVPETTVLTGNLAQGGDGFTFTFQVNLGLKENIKL